MKVYNTSAKGNGGSAGVFIHFGETPRASVERVEGMFAHQSNAFVSSSGWVRQWDLYGRPIGDISIDQHLMDFCDFAETFRIQEYTLSHKKLLRINDLWEDDPIGSAGPNLVGDQLVNREQVASLRSIFSPFSDVIYPEDIFKALSKKDIKRIRRRYDGNTFFQEELNKRKSRAKSIGEDFRESQYQGIVWLDLTFKFRSWALEHGYDALVYTNVKEGGGADNYVTLMPGQVERTGRRYAFLREKYLDEMPSLLRKESANLKKNASGVVVHALWCQKDPMPYWEIEQ